MIDVARDETFHVCNLTLTQLLTHSRGEFVIPPIRSGVPLAMTAITRNLPWFVKDLGVSIVGQVRNTTNLFPVLL